MAGSKPTRERILQSALDLLPRAGFAGLTVGRLASETGMSKSGLFGHFGSQTVLQIAVIEAAAARFNASVITPAQDEADKAARLEQLAALWLYWLTRPGLGLPCPLIQAAFSAPGLTDEAGQTAIQIRSRFAPYIARQAEAAKTEGAYRADLDAALFAFSFEAIGLAVAAQAMRDAEAARHRAEAAFAHLFADAAA
ncbi:MAG: TetR/AcrR family transcriptional regulator [Pseudomonadota bacterium]